jgi:hypothetical protein
MNINGYIDTKGLGAKGGVLSYGDLNIPEKTAMQGQERPGIQRTTEDAQAYRPKLRATNH